MSLSCPKCAAPRIGATKGVQSLDPLLILIQFAQKHE